MNPTFDTLVATIGAAGLRMAQLDAAEGAAGNISVFCRELALPRAFAPHGVIDLPVDVPALAGGSVIVTGSGRRLRDLATTPETTLCVLHVHEGGHQATLHAAADVRPTSELNSHLAIHNDHVARRQITTYAVVHAQPLRITFLSHIARYTDQDTLNRSLLRWQPETIIEFPEGIGTLPFEVPGSSEQMQATVVALRDRRAVVWQKHGIVTRAAEVGKAADLVDYAEAAARYEYLSLHLGEPSAGLSDQEIRLICERLGIRQTVF
jgi:rhamnulose-1-phosphate aldolase